MRIIAGELGGRVFKSPSGNRTHPMSDKVRGALFAILGDVHGLTVLDAFAGSGALAFEAVSRGASSALAIERDRSAQIIIAENNSALQLEGRVRLVKASAAAWLDTTADSFDIVVLDPPYDNLQPALLLRLTERLKPGGRLVLSWPGKQPPPELPSLLKLTEKQYGDASLHVYERAK